MTDLERRVVEAAIEHHAAALALERMAPRGNEEKAPDYYLRKGSIEDRARHARTALSLATLALKAERLKNGPAA